MQLPNLSALKIDHKAAPTGYIDVPDVDDLGVQTALQALHDLYDNDDDDLPHKEARLGGLEVVPKDLRNNKRFYSIFCNSIYHLGHLMFLPRMDL